MKNISRIDHKNTHGWYVRIYGKGTAIKQKLFSDLKHGGKEKALDKARIFRDEKLALMPNGRYPMQVRNHIKNTSGQIGISRRKIKQKSGNKPEYIIGFYYDNSKKYEKAFSVNKWGEGRALRNAAEFRNKGMANISNRKIRYLEELKKVI